MPARISIDIAKRLEFPQGRALHSNDGWRDWSWVARFARRLEDLIAPLGLPKGAACALVSRNCAHHAAALAAQLAAGRATTMIYSAQSAAALAGDIRALRPGIIFADACDWSLEVEAAAGEIGAFTIIISSDPEEPVQRAPHCSLRPDFDHRVLAPEVAIELLTSGTTGPPKRLPLSWEALDIVIADARAAYAAPSGASATPPPVLVVHPIGNVAGVSYVAAPLAFGDALVFLEKFDVAQWVDAVRTHKPTRTPLPPTAIQMILDAGVARDDLASLKVIGTGGAALDPELQAKFEEYYGVAILPAFGATEFGGIIANWTLDLHAQWARAKRGSAGRARPGVTLRVVDRENLQPLGAGEIGLLQAITPRTGDDWIRTNDLASIDADGFLFLHGRADNAINRGGFKVVPEAVADVLRQHPAVTDAAVVAIADRRLGQAPVAAVETNAPLSADELTAFARARLLTYQMPLQIRIVERLPRNASLKVALAEVRALFEAPQS